MTNFFRFGRLEIIVFISGAVVMVLELTGSRILAPFLGTSIIVWSSVISGMLGALSLGYYLGGKLSRQNVRIVILGVILVASALLILLLNLLKQDVLTWSAGLGIQLGSIVATLVLLAPPSVTLGMVSPYAIRLKAQTLETTGQVAGNLYALSTLGSITGTLLAGFVLIPNFGSTELLYGLSATLVLCAGLSRLRPNPLLLLIPIAGLLLLPSQPKNASLVYEADTPYNHIRVIDGRGLNDHRPIRALMLATETHSIIYKDGPDLAADYQRYYQLDHAFRPNITAGLTLGGGAYISPRDFLRRFPEGRMTVVEIDKKITATAEKFFDLQPDPRLTILHQDGRTFLRQDRSRYDVIYGDAFASYFSIPFELTTREAMQSVADRLAEDGIFVLNLISAAQGSKGAFFHAQYRTLQEVFPQLYVFLTQPQAPNLPQNIVVIASKTPQRLERTELERRVTAEQIALLDNLWDEQKLNLPQAPILTDNFAPVDYYIAKLL